MHAYILVIHIYVFLFVRLLWKTLSAMKHCVMMNYARHTLTVKFVSCPVATDHLESVCGDTNPASTIH